MTDTIPNPAGGVSADLVDDFGADIEAEVEKLEMFADNLIEQAETAGAIASAILELARGMRKEADRARLRTAT